MRKRHSSWQMVKYEAKYFAESVKGRMMWKIGGQRGRLTVMSGMDTTTIL